MTDYMVTGLVKKRAALAGELEACHNRISVLVQDIEHLDATLRIVAPDMEPETIAPKLFRPPADWSKRGQMSRMMLSILRTSKGPLTSREIASRLILERGMAMDDKLLRLMSKRCASSLRDLRAKGRVHSQEGEAGFWQLWEIVRG